MGGYELVDLYPFGRSWRVGIDHDRSLLRPGAKCVPMENLQLKMDISHGCDIDETCPHLIGRKAVSGA
jgi:hypothetical protein